MKYYYFNSESECADIHECCKTDDNCCSPQAYCQKGKCHYRFVVILIVLFTDFTKHQSINFNTFPKGRFPKIWA